MDFNGSYFIQEKGKPIDLWHPGIEWHDCPKELASAVTLVEPTRSKDDPLDLFDMSNYVCVSGEYVFATDRSRTSRFRLSSPAPFNMAIYHNEEASFFDKVNQESCNLSRIATLDMFGECGLAFDFGDSRAWCLSRTLNPDDNFHQRINAQFIGRTTKVIKEVSDNVVETMEEIYRRALAENYCCKYYLMTVNIKNGEIIFSYKTEKGTVESACPLNSDCYVHSMSFVINPLCFFEVIRRWCSMSLLNSHKFSAGVLYFKETKYQCEHVVSCKINDIKLKI